MQHTKNLITTAIISSLATASIIYWVLTPASETVKIQTTLDDSPATNLQQQLIDEIATRQALQQQLEQLQTLLANLTEASLQETTTPSRPTKTNYSQPHNNGLWFDDKLLLDLGISSQDVQQLKDRFEQAELEKVALLNKANAADNVSKGKKLRELLQSRRNIDIALQQDLTEQEYDRLLYASGKNNRVVISDLLANSAAAIAGLQKGDVLLRYGGEKIYKPATLYKLTPQGTAGELVDVVLLRDNERINIYLPRGYLGTRFKSVRGIPE